MKTITVVTDILCEKCLYYDKGRPNWDNQCGILKPKLLAPEHADQQGPYSTETDAAALSWPTCWHLVDELNEIIISVLEALNILPKLE